MKRNPLSQQIRALCEARLAEVSQVDITDLNEFAERSLVLKGLNPDAGQDLVQRALAGILQGLETDQGGRVPRLVNVINKDQFQNYVRGAISSVLEAMGRRRQFRAKQEPWEDGMAASRDGITATAAQNAEMSDLKDQLFSRLRDRAPRRLRRTIDAWEAVFGTSDRIPDSGDRHYVGEVQDLAQEIITELGGIR